MNTADTAARLYNEMAPCERRNLLAYDVARMRSRFEHLLGDWKGNDVKLLAALKEKVAK